MAFIPFPPSANRNILVERFERVQWLRWKNNYVKNDPRRLRRIAYIEKKIMAARAEMLRREQAADAAHQARVEYAARNYLSFE